MTTSEKFGRTTDEWDQIVKLSLAILEEAARNQSLISYSVASAVVGRMMVPEADTPADLPG